VPAGAEALRDLGPVVVVLADQIPGLPLEESIAYRKVSGDKPLW
jgi:hypothetical protein